VVSPTLRTLRFLGFFAMSDRYTIIERLMEVERAARAVALRYPDDQHVRLRKALERLDKAREEVADHLVMGTD
jgi:hypothetical protein